MIKNWKVTAVLASPLAGEAPALDAILEYELAQRLGYKHARKLTRNVPLSEIERPPIPVVRYQAMGRPVYQCSDPILSPVLAEWTEHQNKRLDLDMSLLVEPAQRRKLLVASGPYKMRHVPLRVRLVESVSWFVRGDRAEINKLLKKIRGLGAHRNIGYGIVHRWEYEKQETDYSLFAPLPAGGVVLMKTLPAGPYLEGVEGFRASYGGGWPPYWHPENYTEIAVPC